MAGLGVPLIPQMSVVAWRPPKDTDMSPKVAVTAEPCHGSSITMAVVGRNLVQLIKTPKIQNLKEIN